MTKEELAKKKGIKLPAKKETPAEALITNTSDADNKNIIKDSEKEEKSKSSKSNTKKTASSAKKTAGNSKRKQPDTSDSGNLHEAISESAETAENKEMANNTIPNIENVVVVTDEAKEAPPVIDTPKRGVGKPKKRKPGDKRFSLWIDEALVSRMYNHLAYGDSAGELLNKALHEYLDNHDLH